MGGFWGQTGHRKREKETLFLIYESDFFDLKKTFQHKSCFENTLDVYWFSDKKWRQIYKPERSQQDRIISLHALFI